jgi:hypothetical protein
VSGEGKHSYGSIRDGIDSWLENAPPGREFHYGEIAEDLGTGPAGISAALLRRAKAGDPLLAFGSKAGWYVRADPDRAPRQPAGRASGDVLEIVGTMKSGSLLLRAEDGSLWEAKEL